MKIETTINAFTHSQYCMDRFTQLMSEGKHEEAANTLAFTDSDMKACPEYVKVGTAHVTIELLDAKEIQNEQLASLQAQLQKERADSQVRQNAILEQISKLQALEWEGVQA